MSDQLAPFPHPLSDLTHPVRLCLTSLPLRIGEGGILRNGATRLLLQGERTCDIMIEYYAIVHGFPNMQDVNL